MRGATKVTRQLHHILRLPRKMNLMIDPRHIWNVIYNARSNKRQTTSSPNTAPATQNESHDWSASHMKRHFQCAEQAMSPSNLTKYCACHEIFKFKIALDTLWIASANRKTIRRHSEDNPRIKSSSRTRRFGDLTRPISETILYWKIQHFALRLSPKMSPNAAPATKSHTPTSPNTAPATQNESLGIYSLLASIHSCIYSLLASILSWHLFSFGIYSLLASILSWHLFSFGIYSLLASILSWHLFPLGIYSLLASIPSWHLFSLGIYSLLASILSWHLFATHLFSRHLFSLGIYSLGIYSLGIYSLGIYSLGIYSLLPSIL